MKSKTGNNSLQLFGLISIGLLITGSIGLWIWKIPGFFPHGMFQSSMIYYEINPWGIFLVLGVVLLIVFGAISMTKNIADQNNREIPDCPKCGEELANADWEACPVCGESIEAK